MDEVRYRIELSQTERSELTALLSGGKQAARKLKRAQICWPLTRGSATMILRPAWASAARPSTGPSSASCSAIWRQR